MYYFFIFRGHFLCKSYTESVYQNKQIFLFAAKVKESSSKATVWSRAPYDLATSIGASYKTTLKTYSKMSRMRHRKNPFNYFSPLFLFSQHVSELKWAQEQKKEKKKHTHTLFPLDKFIFSSEMKSAEIVPVARRTGCLICVLALHSSSKRGWFMSYSVLIYNKKTFHAT